MITCSYKKNQKYSLSFESTYTKWEKQDEAAEKFKINNKPLNNKRYKDK
jgi:hypothetical protein